MVMSSSQASNMMAASMAASALSSIATAFESSAAIKAQGDYSSTIANSNAAMAKLKATQTLQAGDTVASRQNLKTQSVAGSVRAAGGASGIDVNSGSSAMVQSDIRTVGAIDEATIRNNAARVAWGYQVQASQDTFQGQFDQLTAKSKSNQSLVTGGLQAVSGPMAMYSQSALLKYRYGLKGDPGVPFPGGGGGSGGGDPGGSDFWTVPVPASNPRGNYF